MKSKKFLQRLQKELPSWVNAGWVTSDNQEAILAHVSEQEENLIKFSSILAIMGALLLGIGVILFFAANWSMLNKLTKLVIAIGSLWTAYLAAAYYLINNSIKFGQALLLLGVLLFGANIMLIAQIYHIDSHYPDGVLFWSLGGLLTAYVFRSQAALVCSFALAIFWHCLEVFYGGLLDNPMLHWPLLFYTLACLPLIISSKWQFSFHLLLVSLLLLLLPEVFLIYAFHFYDEADFSVLVWAQTFVIAYLGIFLGVQLVKKIGDKYRYYLILTQKYCFIALLTIIFLMAEPGYHYDYLIRKNAELIGASYGILLVYLFMLTLIVSVYVYAKFKDDIFSRAVLLLSVAGLCVFFVNMFASSSWLINVLLAFFNLLFVAITIALIYFSLQRGDVLAMNFGFFIFAIFLIMRYFDLFLGLLDRSLFFIAGGLLLLLGGYIWELKRRQIKFKCVEGDK